MSRPSKRADILQAGVALIHQRGYGAASVESVVEAAGVPKGSFFNHFGSKEGFAGEALDAYFAPLAEKSEAILGRDDLSPTQKLQLLLRVATGKAKGSYYGCMIGNLSLELANQSEPLRAQLSGILKDWSKIFERVIREGQSVGDFEPTLSADKIARFIINLFQGAALRSKVERSERATKEFEEIVLTTLAAHTRIEQ